jgi:hypothetical protein
MMKPFIRKAILVAALFSVTCFIYGQDKSTRKPVVTTTGKAAKPYKILTSGNRITVESKQNLRSLLVWTASGHRIVEEKGLTTTTYSFSIPAKEKVFFMVIETAEGKRFTEKMGVK